MFFTVYQTKNTVNQKIYIGTHITVNPNDDYLGSGNILKKAIKKYGISSFEKTVLFCYDNSDEMFAKEAEIVNEEFIARSDTYNIKCGGLGGWDYVNKSGKNIENGYATNKQHLKHIAVLAGMKIQQMWNDPYNIEWQIKTKQNMSRANKGHQNFLNHKHTPNTIIQMKQSHVGKHDGSKNSQYGTCWITNGMENKKIKKEELDKHIQLGYYKGRI